MINLNESYELNTVSFSLKASHDMSLRGTRIEIRGKLGGAIVVFISSKGKLTITEGEGI